MNNNIEKFVYVLLLISILLLIVPIINLKYNFIDSIDCIRFYLCRNFCLALFLLLATSQMVIF